MAADFWKYLSVVWSRLSPEDRKKIESVWAGKREIIKRIYAEMYRVVSSMSFEKLPLTVREYIVEVDTSKPVDSDVVSIPVLRDGIDVYTTEYSEGVDYAIDSGGNIVFSTPPAQTVLYAPWVEKKNPDIWSYAMAVQLNRSAIEDWEWGRVFDTVGALLKAYVNGATVLNVRSAIAVMLNIPYAKIEGDIISVSYDGTNATVTISDGKQTVDHVFAATSAEYNDLENGHVEQYQPLIKSSIYIELTAPPTDTRVIRVYDVTVNATKDVLTTRVSHNLQVGDIIRILNLTTGMWGFKKITSITGNDITIESPLHFSVSSSDNVVIRKEWISIDSVENYNKITIKVNRSGVTQADADSPPVSDFIDRMKNPKTFMEVVVL